MTTVDAGRGPGDDIPPAGKAMEAAILFADLVSSSEFASVMSLQEYADYVASFQETCARQCEYFFKTFHAKMYRPGDYQFSVIGDELAVFVHSGSDADDVYQLICLAQALKCAWLGSPVNAARVAQGAPSVELAIGIHAGLLWAMPGGPEGPVVRGFVINVAKRVETSSREGQHFRIMISGAAFKRVNRRIRNLLIGPKDVARMKGIVMSVAIHEVIDSFIDPTDRMPPESRAAFSRVAHGAMKCNSFDVWIHSCYQLIEGRR